MKRLCMERNSTTGGGLMKRNNVNRVLLNDFLGADYADYTDSFVSRKLHLEYSYLHCNPCNPRNPRLKFSYILIFFLLCFSPLHAQDPIPSCPLISKVTANCDTLRSYSQRTDTVAVPQIAFPSGFQQLGENELTDSLGILNPFWEKLRLLHAGFSTDTIRIVHIGDSHIRGRILPRTTGTLLTETFGAISYTDMGINGAFVPPLPVPTVFLILPPCILTWLYCLSERTKAITDVITPCYTTDKWMNWCVCFATVCPMYPY